jgi:hypothetical protein
MPYWPISDSRFNNIKTDIRKFPWPDPTRTLSISGGAQRRPPHAVVGRALFSAVVRWH